MSRKRLCRALVLGTVLFGGSIIGMPMRPEEIEELLSNMSQPKVEIVIDEIDSSHDWRAFALAGARLRGAGGRAANTPGVLESVTNRDDSVSTCPGAAVVN